MNRNPTPKPQLRALAIASAALLGCTSLTATVLAGHSRHSYVDGGRSMDGRYVVSPKLVMGEKPKKGPTPYHWTFTWRDTKTGDQHSGRLEGLRSGSSNVFDPVGSHIFVAPDGQTFALWTPQVMMRAPAKKPEGDRDSKAYRSFEGFSRRLVIYRKTGEVIKSQFEGSLAGLTADQMRQTGIA